MPLPILFWVLMIVWLLFGWYVDYEPEKPFPFRRGAWRFMVFILLGILGYAQFGGPVK